MFLGILSGNCKLALREDRSESELKSLSDLPGLTCCKSPHSTQRKSTSLKIDNYGV